MVTIHLRKAGSGDSESVARLLSEEHDWPGFDHGGSITDFWEWRYQRNPLGFANEIVAESDGSIRSHAGSLPAEVRIGQVVRQCAQLSDLFTEPGSRGQGIMESVTQALFAADAESGVELELAFPSPGGYELTMKAGFTEVAAKLGHYELIVNPDRFFQNVKFGKLKKVAYDGMMRVKGRGNGLGADVDVQEMSVFPEDTVGLTEEFERRFDVVFHRDMKYLHWRYEHPEGGTYKILVARREGAVSGYAILRPYKVGGKGYVDLIDIVALPEDEGTLRALVEKGVELCRASDIDMLQSWLPIDHPFLPALGRSGFLQRQLLPGEWQVRLMARPLSEDKQLHRVLGSEPKCHLAMGDTDWV